MKTFTIKQYELHLATHTIEAEDLKTALEMLIDAGSDGDDLEYVEIAENYGSYLHEFSEEEQKVIMEVFPGSEDTQIVPGIYWIQEEKDE